jgi:hypothetical protein
MVEQSIPIMPSSHILKLLTLSLISCGLLTSCGEKIPEGDIKDFVDAISYDTSAKNVVMGTTNITSSYYSNDNLEGKVSVTNYFNKEDLMYFYSITQVEGTYYGTKDGQYNYHQEEILTYIKSDNSVYSMKKTDSTLTDLKYLDSDVKTSINNVFYIKLESGYHSGGAYYGDYIIANCAKYYSFFSLNETKDILTYKVNFGGTDKDGNEISGKHQFSVNKDGMILSLLSITNNLTAKTRVETSISGDYTTNFNKLEELK